jgi:hypothetical protein
MFSVAGSSYAVTTTYNDRTLFNTGAAVFGAITTDGYETYPNDLQTGARTFALNYFQVSYTLSGDDSLIGVTDVINPDGGSGAGPTVGTKYLYANYATSAVPSATVTFILNSPVRAFGTDIKDLELANLSWVTSSGASGSVPTAGNGVVQFFGITSDTPFTSIAFSAPGMSLGDGVAFDQTSIVPEPTSVILLPCCISFLGLRTRRRCHVPLR